MIKLPDKLPPSIVVILTILIFGPIFFFGGYFYCKEQLGRKDAEATVERVIDGEQKAAKIRIEREIELEEFQQFKEKVNDGKIKISDGKHVNPDIVDKWMQSIKEAQP